MPGVEFHLSRHRQAPIDSVVFAIAWKATKMAEIFSFTQKTEGRPVSLIPINLTQNQRKKGFDRPSWIVDQALDWVRESTRRDISKVKPSTARMWWR